MTAALLLSTRSMPGVARPDLELAALRLLDGSDADGDGVAGWGLPQELDAFADGTVNPRDHEYSITTALVIHALLDYRPLGSDATQRRIDGAVSLVAETWTTRFWDEEGSFYWYSPTDRIATININAMMAGALARASLSTDLQPGVRAAVHGQAEDVIRFLGAQATGGRPFWRYGLRETDKTQDLVHHAYTLIGIEWLRAAGHEIPWTRTALRDSLRDFWSAGTLMEYPVALRPPGPLGLRHARLWGAGAAMAIAANLGDAALAGDFRRWIHASHYGEAPELDLWAKSDPRHGTAAPSPRHLVHAAWGMAALDCARQRGVRPGD